MGYGEFYRLI